FLWYGLYCFVCLHHRNTTCFTRRQMPVNNKNNKRGKIRFQHKQTRIKLETQKNFTNGNKNLKITEIKRKKKCGRTKSKTNNYKAFNSTDSKTHKK
ncbi:hypothetical protein DOY81_000892, partial [Sarcophaga bullata]